MRATGHHIKAILRDAPAFNDLALTLHFQPCTKSHSTCVQTIKGRRENDAQYRDTVFNQRDIDGELAIALDKFLGSIKRVNQPEALP